MYRSTSSMVFKIIPILYYAIQVCALENLALSKPTWEQNPWPDLSRDFGSANAVDGWYENRGPTGGQCTISNEGSYTTMWRVDLESVVSISHIKIYYRTDNQNPGPYVDRMAGFSLYVSNTTSKEEGHLCYKDKTGRPSVDQNIPCSIYGRYVIYYNERNQSVNTFYYSQYAFNELCEVEVYGCKEQFWKNCPYSCPATCKDQKCETNTDQCRDCIPGYQDLTCRKECKNGYFGPECSRKCGHCLESKHCHHINGSCLNGCSHGYRGDLCNETCPSGFFGLDCINRCDTYCTGNESCDPVMGICNEGCKKGWSGLMCDLDRFSNRQSCGDNTPIVIGVVLSVVIVLFGSVINFIYWRRKRAINVHARQNNSDPKADNKDESENTSQQYTELGEVNKSSNYDDLYNYSN